MTCPFGLISVLCLFHICVLLATDSGIKSSASADMKQGVHQSISCLGSVLSRFGSEVNLSSASDNRLSLNQTHRKKLWFLLLEPFREKSLDLSCEQFPVANLATCVSVRVQA